MTKLKFNLKTEEYKLTINHDQIMLISKLLGYVRLGANSDYSQAAFELLNAIEHCDPSMPDEASEWISLVVSIDDINGEEHPIYMRDGDNPIFDLDPQSPSCRNHDDPSFDDTTVGEFIAQ